jgi:flagellar hook-length control protein FliK
VAPVATTISASAQLEAATEPSREGGANEESLPLDQQQHQEGLGESTGAEDPSLAPALAEGETANVHPSTIKSTGARQEIAQTLSGNQESGVKATTEQRSPAEGAEVQVAPSETSGTVSKESEAAESQVAESILLASGNGIALGTRSTRNTAVQTTEDLIARSIEALIHQNVLTVAGKPNLETSPLQRTIGTVSAANITQPSVNSAQSLVHGDTQRGAVVREKAASRELPRAAQLRTLEKVEHALKEVARSKDGKTISLRLDPPSLGTLKIDVTFRDNQLHARFVGESPQVNALLREQSHELQQMLRKAGVSAERIVISVASEGGVDLREGFELFDRNATQQFKEQNTSGSNERGSVSSGVMVDGGVTSGIVPVTPAVEDHWIA